MAIIPYVSWNQMKYYIKTGQSVKYNEPIIKYLPKTAKTDSSSDDSEKKKFTLQIQPDCPLTDYYALLGLSHRNHLATLDEITRAYKKISLIFHPDKVQNKTHKEKTERYKAIQKAYDTFRNTHNRLIYDSSQEFDDSIPTYDSEDEPENFGRYHFSQYRKAFTKFAHYSIEQPVPEFGDEHTDIDVVVDFYDFWFNFRSWRDFSYLGEHDLTDADNREHRRWMIKENKSIAKAHKKQETITIKKLVRNAQKQDPRWKLYLQREKEKIKAAKEARRKSSSKETITQKPKQETETIKIDLEAQRKNKKKRRKLQQKFKRILRKLTNEDGLMKQFKKEFEEISKIVGNSYEEWEKINNTTKGITTENSKEKIKNFKTLYQSYINDKKTVVSTSVN